MNAELLSRAPHKDFLFTTFQRRLALRESQACILPADKITTPELRQQQYDRLESMIGNTPLVGINTSRSSLILVKYESQNPTESHYDRVYIKTLRKLEEQGVIQPGDELYEVTSGSAGISFAWLCSRLGYESNIFVPKSLPEARKQEVINFGANLIEEEGYVGEASKEEWRQFVHFAKDRKYKLKKVERDDFSVIVAEGENKRMCLVNHSENPITSASLEVIGDEVASVIPKGVGIDYFISVLGNGSNTIGVTNGLKKRFKHIQTIGVEDWDNPVQFEKKYPGEYERRFGRSPSYAPVKMYGAGTKTTAKLKFIDVARSIVDDIRLVPQTLWEEKMKEFNSGIPVETIGISSAGSLVVAEQLAQEHPAMIALVIAYDKGDRYGTTFKSLKVPGVTDGNVLHEQKCIPPVGWKQWTAASPVNLPTSIYQSYESPETVSKENLRNWKYIK
jgi:S-sulfo-L-cysteine synthase (O-acetyl-L-serine-dependent)